MKEILARHFNFAKVKTAIIQKVEESKKIGSSVIALRLIEEEGDSQHEDLETEKEETEEDKKKRIGYPSDNVEQLIKDAGFEESL